MAAEVAGHANILIELNKAVKMHNFYPLGHPNLEFALERCFNALKEWTAAQGDLKWRVDQKGFYCNEKTPILGDSEEALSLAKRFFYRRIREITFTSRLEKEDMRVLISALWKEPEEIQAMGGIEEVFARGNISGGILLNELRYEELLELKRGLEEKKEKEREATTDVAEAETTGEEGDEVHLGTGGGVESAPEQTLEELLERIKGETDLLKYNDLTVRIREKIVPMVEERSFGDALPALLVFFEHGLTQSGKCGDIKAIAGETLDSFLTNDDLLRYLIWFAGSGEGEEKRAEVREMLLRRGDRAIELVLEVLVDVPDAAARRNIFNTAALFGKRIVPYVAKRLKSEKWFEVRQMVALLGEIGDPANVDLLIETYGNEDVRIKKEVLKSLARIPSQRSSEFLLNAIGEEDKSLSTQAVVSLGMLRDPSAVPDLGKIALKWEPFSDNHELKKEAIKALGIIGDHEATVCLTKLLFRRKLIGKKINAELRLLAARSLGMIGSKDALQAIEKTYGDSSGDLQAACRRILEGRHREG